MQQNYEEPEYEHILFAPSAYNTSLRATTSKTPSSPQRPLRSTTPGQHRSQTPAPPPLNRVDVSSFTGLSKPLHTSLIQPSIPAMPSILPPGRTSLEMYGPRSSDSPGPSRVVSRPTAADEGSRYPQTWIKICGLSGKEDSRPIIEHFRKCGQIQQCHSSIGPQEGNSMFLKFEVNSNSSSFLNNDLILQNSTSVHRALEYNGKAIVGSNCYGIVKPEDAELEMLKEEPIPDPRELPPINPEVTQGRIGLSPVIGGSAHGSVLPLTPIPSVSASTPIPQRYQGETEPTGSIHFRRTQNSMFSYYKRFLFG